MQRIFGACRTWKLSTQHERPTALLHVHVTASETAEARLSGLLVSPSVLPGHGSGERFRQKDLGHVNWPPDGLGASFRFALQLTCGSSSDALIFPNSETSLPEDWPLGAECAVVAVATCPFVYKACSRARDMEGCPLTVTGRLALKPLAGQSPRFAMSFAASTFREM